MAKRYQNKKDDVWENAKKIRGKNPDHYRKDDYGNVIFYRSYGLPTPMGWEIDHIKPQSKCGTHDLNNLRALQTSANRSRGNRTKHRSLCR